RVRLYGLVGQAERIGLDLDLDISVLSRKGLIGEGYELDNFYVDDGRNAPCFYVSPSMFGIALYSAAFNRLRDWRKYSTEDFGALQGVPTLRTVARTFEGLYRQIGVTPHEDLVHKFRARENYTEPAA